MVSPGTKAEASQNRMAAPSRRKVAREAELTSPGCMTSLLTGDMRPQIMAAAPIAICPFRVPDSMVRPGCAAGNAFSASADGLQEFLARNRSPGENGQAGRGACSSGELGRYGSPVFSP